MTVQWEERRSEGLETWEEMFKRVRRDFEL